MNGRAIMVIAWLKSLFKDGPTARDTVATIGGIYGVFVLIYAIYLAITRL
jgi:hypothetical protein